MKAIFLFLAGLAIAGCSNSNSDTRMVLVSAPDFFRYEATAAFATKDQWVRPTDCRKNIEEAICLVDAPKKGEDQLSRKCLGGESKYIPKIQEIYDGMDSMNQNMFCSLRRIFIEKEFYATAYASSVYLPKDDGSYEKGPGAFIGIRKSVLDKSFEFTDWLSWKEQLNFTANAPELTVKLPYPTFSSPKAINSLQYVLTHEFGHLFDFSNNVNQEMLKDPECMKRVKTEEDYYKECEPYFEKTSWGSFSWVHSGQVKPESDFELRDQVCFYGCSTYMDYKKDSETLYKGLQTSGFVSLYSLMSPYEDFAEAFAVKWMLEVDKSNLIIHASDKFEFDYAQVFAAKKFENKRKYLDTFYSQKVNYP